MKLTCVTATFNCIKAGNRKNLIRCINSISQLKTEHEHLIFDGASTDGTVELLHEMEKRISGLKVVSEPDTGIYNALNKGVDNAQGEWFYVLGADDYICNPEVMDRLIADEGKAENPCNIIATTVERDKVKNGFSFFQRLKDLEIIFENTPCCHQGEIVRTEVMRELGGFDESYTIAADANLFFKAHLKGYSFRYMFESFAYYSYGGISETKTELAVSEFYKCIGCNLGLTQEQTDRLRYSKILPFTVSLRYLIHFDLALRLGAQRMLKRHWYRSIVGRLIGALLRRARYIFQNVFK